MGLIGQGGEGGPVPGTAEQCKRDYEKDIGNLLEKADATIKLHMAIMQYSEVIRPSLYRPDTFTFPQLIGHLILQEKELNRSRDALVAEWARVREEES